MANEETSILEALPEGAFDGRQAFLATLRAALGHAARENWRELILSDDDFADWPLGERATANARAAFSLGSADTLIVGPILINQQN